MDEVVCANCGEIIEEGTERYTLEDGSIVCECCYDEMYGTCDICGERVPVDDLTYWGDCLICPDCLDEQCPDFDQEGNEEDTTAAYEAMRARYIGRHTERLKAGDHSLDYRYETDGTEIVYDLMVTVDNDGVITDVTRLSASKLLSEALTSSEYKPYPIDKDDYESIVDEMLEKYLTDEEDEKE